MCTKTKSVMTENSQSTLKAEDDRTTRRSALQADSTPQNRIEPCLKNSSSSDSIVIFDEPSPNSDSEITRPVLNRAQAHWLAIGEKTGALLARIFLKRRDRDDPSLTNRARRNTKASVMTSKPEAATKASIVVRIKRNNMELQFWGYEVGNVLATIAGAGGFLGFYSVIQSVFYNNQSSGVFTTIGQLLSLYPDATVALGLGALVLIVPALRARIFSKCTAQSMNVLDLITTIIAIAILCYAIVLETSWIAIASSFFVVGSCLLRQCRKNPIMLKAGGLALACGGLGLSLYGLQVVSSMTVNENNSVILMGALTVVTGVYVFFAGLLTYEGGIFATRELVKQNVNRVEGVWLDKLAHPEDGLLVRGIFNHTDKSILIMNSRISKPAIFWVSDFTRNNRPFKTSMLARLPWRILTGLAALFSMTPAGFAFFTANVCWAIGDVAIGSEDW